jgi:ABC-2 type transport system permease protein
MIATLTHASVLTRRVLQHWARQPATPIFGLAFSIMLLLIFALLFGGAMEVPGGAGYISFLVPGMLTLAMMFGVEATMSAITADSKRGITDRFRSMPIGSAAVALGRVGADLTNSAAELLVLILGGLLIGWRISTDPAAAALAVLLLLFLRFAMLWVGVYVGLSFRGEGATMAVQVLVWPIAFLSNAIVSAETMPAWLGAIAAWNPLSATASAVRELFGNPTGITDGPLSGAAVWLALGWPLLLTAIFLPLSARAYRRLRN